HRLSDLRQSGQKVQGELERLLERREQMGVQLHELAEEALRLDEETRATADRLGAIVGERESGRQALAGASRLAEERARTANTPARATARACAPCSTRSARRRWRASWERWRISSRCRPAWSARSRRSLASASSGWWSNGSSTRARRSGTSGRIRWEPPRFFRS